MKRSIFAVAFWMLLSTLAMGQTARLITRDAALSQETYTMMDLGSGYSLYGINNLGHIVANGPCPNCLNSHALFWTPETGFKNIGALPGDSSSSTSGFSINDLDQIVGSSGKTWVGNTCCDAFLWTPGKGMRDLGTFLGCDSLGLAINDLGEVAGETSQDGGGDNGYCPNFVWTSSQGLQPLGIPLGAVGAGIGLNGLNNQGVLVGGYYYYKGSNTIIRSYIWNNHTGFRDLGIPNSEAPAINNRGHVVGRYRACDFCDNGYAFLWEPEIGVRDLGVLPGQIWSYAVALNAYDHVVGASGGTSVAYPFLWTESTGMVNLNNLVVNLPSGWQLQGFANGINNKGQIITQAILPNGDQHAILLTPR
jgi:probable HAF family extracellular repeat protein